MSVYHVAQWSVGGADAEACEKAIEAMAEHVRTVHPTVASFRIYRQLFGPLPWRGYLCHAEYENLVALEADPDTPACDEAWAPIFAVTQPGSFAMSIWSDPQRATWFER